MNESSSSSIVMTCSWDCNKANKVVKWYKVNGNKRTDLWTFNEAENTDKSNLVFIRKNKNRLRNFRTRNLEGRFQALPARQRKVYSHSLIVTDIEFADAAEYHCEAAIDGLEPTTASLTLKFEGNYKIQRGVVELF